MPFSRIARLALATALASAPAGCGEGLRTEEGAGCDPVADTGCPEGEHCRVVAGGRFVCLSPLAGAAEGGCVPGSCPPRNACLAVGGLRACRPLCRGDGDCPDGGRCALRVEEGLADVQACAFPCTLAEGCPEPGAHCTVAGDLPFPVCLAAGGAGPGAPCDAARCAAGLGCVRGLDDAEFACRRLCDPTGAVECPDGERCRGVIEGVSGAAWCVP